RSARTATQILTDSFHAKQRILAIYGVPDDRVTVAHLAAESRFFVCLGQTEITTTLARLGVEAPYIFSLAAPGYQKNLDTLIEGFIALRQMLPGVIRLVLVGTYDFAASGLGRRLHDGGLTDAVTVLGWAADADLPALYQGAELFVHPSRYEGF